MKTNMNLTILAVLASVYGLSGCNKGPGAYVPKPVKEVELVEIKANEGPSLFPINEGNKWTYSVESRQEIAGQASNKTDELSLTIVDVTKSADGQIITLQSALNGENTEKQAWLVNEKGIYQTWVKNDANKFVPPMPNVVFPLTPGQNFVYKGTGPTVVAKIGTQSYTGNLLKTQLVDTDMGRFSAICIESTGTFGIDNAKGQSMVTTFWAKGVGLVRYKQDTAFMTPNGAARGTQLIKLKTYTLK